MDRPSLKYSIQAKAKDLGFSFIAFTQPIQTPHFQEYENWVTSGKNGIMVYLEEEQVIQARRDPKSLLKSAKSVIVFGQHYHLSNHLIGNKPENGIIASYARYPDYHHVLKQKAGQLVAFIESRIGYQIAAKVFVDSSQVMEKDFAYLAGAGWIGKNSLLIVPPYGSNCTIGCIMTDLELLDEQVDLPQDLCGDCRLCIDSCPTRCIQENRTIDARKCIAYLTIEYKGIIPRSLRPFMGNRIFGCDHCQAVCPLNGPFDEKNCLGIRQTDFVLNGEIELADALSFTKEEYHQKFMMTPVIRASYEMFIRNVLIAVGNSHRSQFSNILRGHLENAESSLIRSHAAWALGMVDPKGCKDYFKVLLNCEQDEHVRKEIGFFLDKPVKAANGAG